MIPRLVPLQVVLLWTVYVGGGSCTKNGTTLNDDMESYLHGMDSKQTVSVLVPNESVRRPQKLQTNEDRVPELKATTEGYQTHIPFGTRLRPLSSSKPYTNQHVTDAPISRPIKKPDPYTNNRHLSPTVAPVHFTAPAPPDRNAEPRTTPLADRRYDSGDTIFITDNPKKHKRRRPKQGASNSFRQKGASKTKHPTPNFSYPTRGNVELTSPPTLISTGSPFKDVPYEPQPPPPPPVQKFRRSDFGEAINQGGVEVGIAPRQPHLPNYPNRYEPVPAARIVAPPPKDFSSPRKPKKKDINFDSILDFIDKPENLKSPKTSGRKRGGLSSGKLFSPKEDSNSSFKPFKPEGKIEDQANKSPPNKNNNKSGNDTLPSFNKRIAFLQDHPFQGSPQASFFFTNVGPNHIEYRGVFDPSSVPINFKDSPEALFQLIPQLPKLFDFDNRGIPPPREPPKPRQPPPLPIQSPPIIEPPASIGHQLPPVPQLNSPPRLPLTPQLPPPAPAIPVRPEDPPRQIYPLALPPPPNLQLPERPQPYPKYDFVRGSFDGYPKIFRFNDERISILDFDKQKKAGQVIRRKGDDLDPERVPRNSFLIFHGGQFPSKENTLSKSRFNSAPKNNDRFSNFVDSGNFLEEPEPPRDALFFSPKRNVRPPITLPPQPPPAPVFKSDAPQTSFQTTKPGGYIYFIRTG